MKKSFENGEIVWDSGNNCYGVVLNNYYPNDYGEIRLDSDGNQPTDNLHKLGSEDDKGTREQLIECLLSHKHLVETWPEYQYSNVCY